MSQAAEGAAQALAPKEKATRKRAARGQSTAQTPQIKGEGLRGAPRKAMTALTEAASNEDVEQALLRKATGYAYVQKESYKLKHVEYDEVTGKKKREWESVEVVEVEKHVPPEYSAIALWLKARMPETWGEAAQGVAAEPVVIVDDIPAQTGTAEGGEAGGIAEHIG